MAEEKVSQQGGTDSAKRNGSLLRRAIDNEVEELGLTQADLVREALKWQYNWIGLAGAALFALLSGTGMPLVLAAGFELIYLSLVPRSSRFRRLVRSWQYAQQKRRREMKLSAMFEEMPPELRTRYAALDTMCQAIRANYSRLSSTSQMFLEQMEQKLQGLLEAYLRLLYAYSQHSQYLESVDPEAIGRETAQLQRTLSSDPPPVQEINRRRVEILSKRLERFDKVRENQKVIHAQSLAIEDILKLIRDQSVTMRDPQQVSDQLESLVHDVEQTEETVKQVEAVFETTTLADADSLAPLPTGSTISDSAPGVARRVRN
jgi:hypothetical protein